MLKNLVTKIRDKIRSFLVGNKFGLFILKLLNSIFKYFDRISFFYYESKFTNNPVVQSGIFKNLRYPKIYSYMSVIFPKLMGIYEKQLHKPISEFKKNNYDTIINIGAAEGYYAVGMALCFPQSKVAAIDINIDALNFLKKMSILNNTQDRVKIINSDAKIFLEKIDPNQSYLVICDCERCEFDIFSEKSIENLKKSDLIIEMHYRFGDKDIEKMSPPEYSKFIEDKNSFLERFKKYHDHEIVKPLFTRLEDIKDLENIPIKHAKKLANEVRAWNAEWLIFKSKYKN